MNKRQQAIELLEMIPESKLDYIIAFLQGAAIPEGPMDTEGFGNEAPAELPKEARGLERSMAALFDGNALLDEQIAGDFSGMDGMDDVYSALEDMARAEINLYQTKDK